MIDMSSAQLTLKEWQRFILNNGHILSRNPTLLFQQAANESNRKAPALAAKACLEKGPKPRPFLRWVNKPQRFHHPCLATFTGHLKNVMACYYSADGRQILSASEDGTLKLWNAETGSLLASVGVEADLVTACCCSPDGRRIAFGSWDGKLNICRVDDRALLISIETHCQRITASCYSPDGKRIVSGSEDKTLKIWDAENGHLLNTLRVPESWDTETRSILAGLSTETSDILPLLERKQGVSACCYSPDGRQIVSASFNDLKLWDVETERLIRTLSGHRFVVTSCCFSPDGNCIVSASCDKTVRVWDASTGALLITIEAHSESVTACCYSPNNLYIASGSVAGIVKVWHAQTGNLVAEMEGHSGKITSCCFSPDGWQVVTASDDATLKLWDWQESLEQVATAVSFQKVFGIRDYVSTLSRPAHAGRVTVCCFSPNGRQVVSGSSDQTLKIWDVDSDQWPHQQPHALYGHTSEVRVCCYSSDGRRILSGSLERTLRIWNSEYGNLLMTLDAGYAVGNCCYSPDSQRIAAGTSDNKLKVWNAVTGEELFTGEEHTKAISGCRYSPDGWRLISGSDDGTLKVWRMLKVFGEETYYVSNRPLGHSSQITGFCLSPDGKRVVSACWGGMLRVWDPDDILIDTSLDVDAWPLTSCSYSPDGRRIVSGSLNGTLKVWDATARSLLFTLAGHTTDVKLCYFSADGQFIISASSDGPVIVWNAETGALITAFLDLKQITAGACAESGLYIAIGDWSGAVNVLHLEGFEIGPAIVTPVHLYRFDKWKWDQQPTARCKLCGHSFIVEPKILDVIAGITRNFGLPPYQSPCLELPAEAWDDPRLLSECPNCRQPLKFNPFVIDNRDRY